ncbi:MAG: DUF1697 domain-containing protein [Chitinispirillaceae bacterium]|nr:DUF1697 domain-containing protein [Chitinispirillaceae bacterium]
MRYTALLRGINVGGTHRVEMKRLKSLFESLGYGNVETYINSGNVIFDTGDKPAGIGRRVAKSIEAEFGFAVPVLILSQRDMRRIAGAVPRSWLNDKEQKTDVAYLFLEIDTEKTIDVLPVRREYIDIRYTRGALYWNVDRKNLARSNLSKIASHPLYRQMTIRNVNTCRYLAEWKW